MQMKNTYSNLHSEIKTLNKSNEELGQQLKTKEKLLLNEKKETQKVKRDFDI